MLIKIKLEFVVELLKIIIIINKIIVYKILQEERYFL